MYQWAVFMSWHLFAGTTLAERAYPVGCSKQDPSYFDYENARFPPTSVKVSSCEDYALTQRLGTGKFSDVFEASPSASPAGDFDQHVVIKVLKPVSERKVRREVLVLQRCSQLISTAKLRAIVIRQNDQKVVMPSLVLEHAGKTSRWFCHGEHTIPHDTVLNDYEIRYHILHLLMALDGLHGAGIMHRDVKPRNVLIGGKDPLMLIDMGLADFYLPNNRYNVRVASRHYKAPELLLHFEFYDYAIDMWGVGCILAGLLFHREPFFRGRDNVDQLGTIMAVLGTDDLLLFLQRYNVQVPKDVEQEIVKYHTKSRTREDFSKWRPTDRPEPGIDAINLLNQLLVYDHDMRLTARQAIQHSYFDSVRPLVEAEVRSSYRKQMTLRSMH